MTEQNHGARWVRAALQVNPYLYQGRSSAKNDPTFDCEQDFNKKFVEECVRQGIELLAITDHWNYRNSEALATEAMANGICVLPGFEANSQENIHILVIFPENTPRDTLEHCIVKCGGAVAETGPGTATFEEIVEFASSVGALAIPAHVNVPKSSLLVATHGESLARKVKNPNILAIGVTPGKPEADNQQQIVMNQAPFQRENPLAIIHADDVNKPEDLSTEGASSWYKMSQIGFDGLALALRSSETRVRVSEPEQMVGATLHSIRWVGGFLDGQKIEIAEDLTALIGGRGSGKSTVIESVRFAIENSPIGEAAKKDFEQFVANVLGPGGQVILELKGSGKTRKDYQVKRTVGAPAIVMGAEGEELPLSVAELVGDIDIFGQHELAEIATDSDYVTKLVERRFVDAQTESKFKDIKNRLACNRNDLLSRFDELGEAEERAGELSELEIKLAHFKEQGLEEKLAVKTEIEDRNGLLKRFQKSGEGLTQHTEQLQTLVGELPAIDVELGIEKDEFLDKLRKAKEELVSTVDSAIRAIDRSVEHFSTRLESLRDMNDEVAKKAQDEMAQAERQLAEEGAQVDSFKQTKARIRELSNAPGELESVNAKILSLRSERREILAELQELVEERRATLKRACRDGNEAAGNSINLRLGRRALADRVAQVMRTEVDSRSTRIFDYIRRDDFELDTFIEALRSGQSAIEKIGVGASQAKKLAAKGESLALKLEELPEWDQVDIRLRIDSPGVKSAYREMKHLSKGQRATTLLLLLLAQKDGILVLDQPEDDLDNHFIYSGIVKRMRQLKNKRQLVVGTHNANIPVLGDAEQIVCLTADGENGKVISDGSGSIDNQAVRAHVETILEGGKEAFAKRSFLYGF